MMAAIGKVLLVVGAVLVVVGAACLMAEKAPFWGRLPGDIRFEGRRWSFYFPIMTCFVLSLILTLVLNLVVRLFLRK